MLQYLYKTGQILVYLTLFLPLVISSDFIFPFITPRNFLFRLLMSIGLVVVGVLWMNYKELRPKKNWLNIAVTSLLVSKFLSAIFGANFYNSFWSGYERMEGVVAWLFFGIFYFLIITVFRKRDEWLWLLRIALIPAFIVAIYGFGQAMGFDLAYGREQARIESTLGNAAYVGAYMAIHIGMALYIMRRDSIKWMKWVGGALAVIFFVALVLTETRGAAVGMIMGVGVALVMISLFADSSYKRLRMIASGILLGVVLSGMLVWVNKDSAFVQNIGILNRLTSITSQETTVKSRLFIWNMAYNGWKERPVFGWGQDNFHYIYNKYYDVNAGEDWVDRAHNNLFDQLAMGGLVGLLAYLAVILFPFYIFYQLRKKDIILSALMLGWWTAYVVQNQFVFDSLNTYIFFFILLALANWKYNFLHQSEYKEIDWQKSQYSTSYNHWIITGMLAASLIINAVINYPGYKANKLAILGLQRVQVLPGQSFDYFQQALDLDSFGNKEIVMQLQIALGTYLPDNKLSDKFKQDVVLYTIKKTEDVLSREPDDARMLIFASNVYRIARIIDPAYMDKSEKVLKRALELSPGRVAIYLALADHYQLLGNSAGVIEWVEKAYKIAPEKLKVMIRYIDVMLALKRNTEAIGVATKVLELYEKNLKPNDLFIIMRVFAVDKQWNNAVLVGERLVSLDNSVAEYWQLLAISYENNGQLDKANKIKSELDKLQLSGK